MIRALRLALALWFALLCVSMPAEATVPPQSAVISGVSHAPGSIVDLNWGAGKFYVRGAAGPLVDARASPATCFDTAGNLVQVAANIPCVAGGAINSWEARTESVPNNTMTGAAIGTSRTISGVTGLSRSGTVTATLLCSTCNAAVGDIVTISGASIGTYNGSWAVTGAIANSSFTFTTATSATDSATGETVAAVSAGTLPTGWTVSPLATAYSVVAVGTNNGYPTIDLRFAGSPNSTSFINIQPMVFSSAPVSYGQTWTAANWFALVGGSLTNISTVYGAEVRALTSGGGFITNATVTKTLTGSPAQAVVSFTPLLTTTAYVNDLFDLGATASQPIDITVRLGIPDLQLNPNIPATVASAATAASGAGGVNGSGVYSVAGGTCATAPTLNVTWAAGVLTVNSVAGAGSCTVLPPSPATLVYVSGAATGWTGATVTLTPTDNSAKAFPTPPILTTNAAVARAADNISMTTQSCANPSILASGTPYAPTAFPVGQNLAQADTGSDAQRTVLRRQASTGALLAAGVGGTGYNLVPSGTWAQSALGKLAVASAPATQSAVFNNGTPATATAATLPTTPTTLHIGVNASGSEQFNGTISRIALACGASLTSAMLDPPANDNSPRFAALGDILSPAEPRAAAARCFALAA